MRNTIKELNLTARLVKAQADVVNWNIIARGEDLVIDDAIVENQRGFYESECFELESAREKNDVVEVYDAVADMFVTKTYLEFLQAKNNGYDVMPQLHDEITYFFENVPGVFYHNKNKINLEAVVECIEAVMVNNYTKFIDVKSITIEDIQDELERHPDDTKLFCRDGYWILFDNNNKVIKPTWFEPVDLKPILTKYGIQF